MTASQGNGWPLSRPVQVTAVAYAVLWIATAISPVSRIDWLLENLLVIAFVAALVATYRRFAFSTTSYVLIGAFLALHAVGAHYTYSEMPLGFVVRDMFGLTRNHYDRFVHFAFGLLLAYPLQELLRRRTSLRGFGLTLAPFVIVLALSNGYELVEYWVALVVSPDAAIAYLGTQGDVFDAQKDTSLAIGGAAIALAVIAARSAWRRRSAGGRRP